MSERWWLRAGSACKRFEPPQYSAGFPEHVMEQPLSIVDDPPGAMDALPCKVLLQ